MNAGGVDKACKSIATPLRFCYNLIMYYVYIIKSKQKRRLYTGYSSDLKQRIEDHNSGKSEYTSRFRPWVLVYYEAYSSKEEAQARERSLKLRSNAYLQLRRRIMKSIDEA